MVIKMQDHGFNPICEGVENTHIHLVVWWCSTQLIGLTFCEMMIMCFINPKSLDLFADQSKPDTNIDTATGRWTSATGLRDYD